MTYQPKTYRTDGGDKIVVVSGGELEIQSGATFDVQQAVELTDDVQLRLGTSDDATLAWATTSTDRLLLAAAANNSRFDIGTSTLSWDIYIDGSGSTITWDASANDLDFNGADLSINDDDIVRFGDSNDVSMTWAAGGGFNVTAAANNSAVNLGTTTASFDVVLDGSASTVTWDASANDLDLNGADISINDDDKVQFGDANDAVLSWATSSTDRLLLSAAANNTRFDIGTSTLSIDLVIDGSGSVVTWDASANDLNFEGADISLNDDDKLQMGDANDAVLSWATTSTDRLLLTAAANNSRLDLGTSTASWDVYLDGSGSTVLWDASANDLDFDGADLSLNDDDKVQFGDSNDAVLSWATTSTARLLLTAGANNNRLDLGTSTASWDIYIDGSAGTIFFDASGDDLDFNAVDLSLNDDDKVNFGDSNDAVLSWATTSTDRLLLTAGANNNRLDIGTSTASWDVIIDGSAGTITWDASANDLIFENANLDLKNSTNTVQFYLAASLDTTNVGPGGFRIYTNSTTAILAVNTTGTTWKTMALN